MSHTPIQQNGFDCRRCGANNPPGAGRCIRCQAFLAGNQEAVRMGLYRRQQPVEIREEAEALVEGIIADKGGKDELSATERAYIGLIADLAIMLRLLVDDMGSHGLFTPGGVPRKSYTAYLAGLDRFDRLAQRLGMTRQLGPLRSNLEAFINAGR